MTAKRAPTSKKTGPLSNADRQRQWRQRHKERLKNWRATLRVTTAGPDRHIVTRNASSRLSPATEDSIDDALTQNRRLGDQVAATYAAFLTRPGLTHAEIQTVKTRYLEWRQSFVASAKTAIRRVVVKGGAK